AKDYAKRNGSEECQYDDLEIDDRRDFYKRRNNVPGNDAQEYADNSGTACHQDRFGQKLQYYVFLLRPKGLPYAYLPYPFGHRHQQDVYYADASDYQRDDRYDEQDRRDHAQHVTERLLDIRRVLGHIYIFAAMLHFQVFHDTLADFPQLFFLHHRHFDG